LFGHDEKWARQTEETVSNHFNQFLDPQITCDAITCHEIQGKWFITIQFKNPGATVYWNKSAYKSAGTTTAEMNPAEIMHLTVSLPGLSDYTAQRVPVQHDDDTVRQFVQMIAQRKLDTPIAEFDGLSPHEMLTRMGIHGTNTCRLLFGNGKYRVVYYDQNEDPINNLTHSRLFGILEPSFAAHVQDWTRRAAGLGADPYPPRALREALSNAVAHAAYMERDGDIIIELFLDRLCISNTCVRESEFFANKWFSRSHNTVNRVMMETLRLAGFVDELGRGKNLIFADSLRSGKQPPNVILERGGRYDRWRLYLYGGTQNSSQLRILDRLREMYEDEQKALIANALILWRGQSVSKIRQYIDGESSRTFAEVLTDLKGPIFYYEKNDEIILRRWVSVLIGEGKDSKQLSDAEEADLLEFARSLQLEFERGYVTPKQLRELAQMGNSQSELVQTSKLLAKWTREGHLTKVRKGTYQFLEAKRSLTVDQMREHLQSPSSGDSVPSNVPQTGRRVVPPD
jgi:predicted HTH transcriptional regulator